MIEKNVRHIYSMLLKKDYLQIESLTQGIRLNANEIGDAILEYGRVLTSYPDQINLDVIEIENSNPKSWSIVAPVYTVEEGLSDLSIEITLIQSSKDQYKIELDDIHVR